MSKHAKVARRRIGRVSIYEHHGGWWVYHREGGNPVRRHVGASAALAECEASVLNARFVANAAGITLDSVPAIQELGLKRVEPPAPAPPGSTEPPFPQVPISELRRAFIAHHENVLQSSLATVSRYQSATLYLETFAGKQKMSSPSTTTKKSMPW